MNVKVAVAPPIAAQRTNLSQDPWTRSRDQEPVHVTALELSCWTVGVKAGAVAQSPHEPLPSVARTRN